MQQPVFNLTKLIDIDLPGLVTSLEVQRADTLVAITKADGSVSLFDRISNQIIESDPTTEKIKHPLQSAFTFSPEEKSPECCLSPNVCFVAKRENDDTVALRRLEKNLIAPEDRALASLSSLCSSSGFLNIVNEDILDRLWGLHETQSATVIMDEITKAININFEFLGDDAQPRTSQLITSTALIKSLSVMENLDSQSPSRSIPSKVASVMLEMRAFCATLHMLMTTPQEQVAAPGIMSSFLLVVNY